ncbi:ATP-dependent RNA helicase RhlE [Chryseobacterium bernardetii]|jgi:ATP-dependent RNA helicase RhlE|uniref:ATP-dependent RNA helicase RhlE n=2 Tax=Chryseobacterium TaxID=59732 RepID=A0A543EIV8_9FLAO|nr:MULTISPECIES: DEAD/DEAH box helicase [Chryseobacterium]MDR6369947.1 ATP-dependent RNA helicase RhlE [Chryseobacterium vietnamense]MDR6440810.1 ATP-dependent RNA helicase RhlE [Chryseobacterium bernardetii]MDR6486686.1 ATP-dependent RNA helicase RhlE [Chryseobacterium vietnamense]TQM21511.1 ATP-dependent RNA helicase RhlE [Chryseobacterium aquifrigidense]
MSFESLGLSHNIIRSVKKLGYLKPFPIQEQAVPVILQGKDLMGIAQTGSGKTACFVMPILEKLQNAEVKKDRNVQVLILVPTRELAIQIDEVFRAFTDNLKREVRTMAVYGGVSINPQMKGMFGVEVLIATPGRLLDLIDHNALSISGIKHLVIDEADKMFQLGFGEEMNKLFAMMPVAKQTTLFSATLNDKVSEMKERLSINPTIIEIKKEEVEIDNIEQLAYHVAPENKGPFLRYLIKEKKVEKALIFVSSTRSADNLVEKLKKNKIKAVAIHSQKSQGARRNNLEEFKVNGAQILVATDLIGRGIHIESLPCVINYELPRSPLDYIHRIGRTGRAHEKGTAITILTDDELQHFRVIQKKMGRKVTLQRTEGIDLHGY